MILYSILIAVYNVEKYLEECLESVLAQSYSNWEVILVDDGSTDEGSGKICDAYVQKDERFQVFHRKNEGSLMARRYGLSKSRGDYLLFIDSDDYIHKDLLKSVDEIIAHTQSDLVIYRFKWVNKVSAVDSEIIFPEGTIIGKNGLAKSVLWEKLPTCNSLNNLWLKVVKRECVDMDADYSEYAFLQFGTDLMQSLPILDRAQKIFFTEKMFYYYRYNDTGISSTKARIKNIESIDRYFQTKDAIMKVLKSYMIKYGADSDKMMKSQYASYFRGCMEILVHWLVHEPDQKLREQILDRTLQNSSLLKCREYGIETELTGIYRRLYGDYRANRINKMKRMLSVLVFYRKLILLKACLIDLKYRALL